MKSKLIWDLDFSHFFTDVTWLPSANSTNIFHGYRSDDLFAPWYLECMNFNVLLIVLLFYQLDANASSILIASRTSHLWKFFPIFCFSAICKLQIFKCSANLLSSQTLLFYFILFLLTSPHQSFKFISSSVVVA